MEQSPRVPLLPRAVAFYGIAFLFLVTVFWIQWNATRRVDSATPIGVHQATSWDTETQLSHLSNGDREVSVSRPCRPGKKLPKLLTLKHWKSEKQKPRESITLMTQLSSDRLFMLENQCRTWPDPLIAIIYVPLLRTQSGPPAVATYKSTALEDVVRGIDSFHAFMESTASCALQIELVGQYLKPESPQPYPINSLRNRALNLAETELVLMLDVDFVSSPLLGLPEPGYRDVAVYNQMVQLAMQKKAIVLPAFEVTNRRQDLNMAQNFARSIALGGKEAVKAGHAAGLLDSFNGRDAPWGHGPTNTTRWLELDGPILYRILYGSRYEPFIIMARRQAPWADERFVGYGGNKIAYINQLNGVGFTFHVHPFGFVVHVPHARTREANIFVILKHRGEAQMEELRASVEQEILENVYVPVVFKCKYGVLNSSVGNSSFTANLPPPDPVLENFED